MRGALHIGRWFGIDVIVDWSWTLIAILMSWNLTAVFHRVHPTWILGGCALVAVLATLLFFASLLAHEFAHALVAKSYGMVVREIRLFLFGGVSDIEREPPSPAAEFWMAIVGPFTSVALGVTFLVAASMTLPSVVPTSPLETLSGLGPLPTLFFWLGPVNVMVGLFNLVPGFPLDGGRILRAFLWKVTGDLHKATFAASLVGRAIGWSFVMTGIAMVFGAEIPFFGHGPGDGVWLAFIGWFLASAAQRSFGSLLIEEVFEGVLVSELMRRTGYAVPAATSVSSVVNEWFLRSGEHAFPVVEDGKLLGLVCVSDVRKISQDVASHTKVETIMTPRDRLAVVTPGEDAQSALRKLGRLDVDQLPVVEGDRLTGMLSRSDVARWLELHVSALDPIARPNVA